MADTGRGLLEALDAFQRNLLSLQERPKEDRLDLPQLIGPSLEELGACLKGFWTSQQEVKPVGMGYYRVEIHGTEYAFNQGFQEIVLQVADELDLDELEAAQLLLDSERDEATNGRSRRLCAIIRFHRQRMFILNIIRLLLDLSRLGEVPEEIEDWLGSNVDELIVGVGPSTRTQKLLPRCMAAMRDIRAQLQKIFDTVLGAQVRGSADQNEFREIIEYSRYSLVQQHELLAVIACHCIDRRVGTTQDFTEFIAALRKIDRYDYSTVHLFPVLGAFISVFGSTEGNGDLTTARQLNDIVCQTSEDDSRSFVCLQAAVKAWWLAEYSGWYVDATHSAGLPVDVIDREETQRSKLFMESLKDGALDMILAVTADVKSSDWQDPARVGIRQWLQRKSPSLPVDTVPFSDVFQTCLATQIEVFVDASISNLPDILRKLRTEEDEQRQMKHGQEQDLDLERFLLIIAYAYEGRPDAAAEFWADPDSNLAGFLQWASRRASTPLVSAFCEMLLSLSEDAECATAAHEFLLDDAHHATGKMRKSSSLSWSQILKELEFYTHKIREKPTAAQTQAYKAGKYHDEQAETEPEFYMMLECYLRLMTTLARQSEQARMFLLESEKPKLVELLFQLISSPVSFRLRACAFQVVNSLLARKTLAESRHMWEYLDSCLGGYFMSPSMLKAQSPSSNAPIPSYFMEAMFEDMSPRFEEVLSFMQLLGGLLRLPDGYGPLNDTLPFPEDLGATFRTRAGVEPYIDYSLGHVFAVKSQETSDLIQQRILRYECLELALTCLSTFNEDLIVFGNETNIPVDAAISTSDLRSYVTLHPFARVMEWMYDSQFVKALMGTIHQESDDIGKAAPDSPLMLSILRGIEVILKVLDLQATYLDVVRSIVKPQAKHSSRSLAIPSSNAAFATIEDGIMTNLNIVSDLGLYCGLGNADLTNASLKLLEKISTSPRIISAWQMGPGRQIRRNIAIVALEENGDADTIAGSFMAELDVPFDHFQKSDGSNYQSKMFILEFLSSTIRANPGRPTVAHLLLGFSCGVESLSVRPGGAFDAGASLFHHLVGIVTEVPISDEGGMQGWLIALKHKAMKVLQALWSSRLSASFALEQLRANEFLFHLLLAGFVLQPDAIWDGAETSLGPDFLVQPGAQGYVDYLSMRAMALEYIAYELCSVAQSHQPALKRRIFDALGGQIPMDSGETLPVSSVFDFNDVLSKEADFNAPMPVLTAYHDLDLRICLEQDSDGIRAFNLGKVKEILLLKRNQTRLSGQLVPEQELAPIETEEALVQMYIAHHNRLQQVKLYNFKVLQAWTKLLMVMADSNDLKGTNRVSFILQTLQAILPSLELYGSEHPEAAYELANLAKVLLFNLDFTSIAHNDKQSRAIGSLVSDKLFQLLQICLDAIAKWTGTPELRTVYYSICFRYITTLVDHGKDILSGNQDAAKSIQAYGERLINVVCDDAYSGNASCQTAALVLLGALVNLGKHEADNYIVEMLNRLNFIGVLVDSLRNVMDDWVAIHRSGNDELKNYENAKLALLLQLCQTRDGAKHVLHSNLFRAIDQSGLFAADPELQVNSSDPRVLENHYALLVQVMRIIGAAIVSRGSHNVLQGRRFLTEHRMLVTHVLKRSQGIGASGSKTDAQLEDKIEELAEAFMVLMLRTGFID
ncbi:uncharacterized protein PG998_000542, partial [Apiospora kogelbergensis]|uniref:uncharacterized protein n=1 Tax=Apiospora kogelbergensis TaxID=1337665 RepID=UPI00312EE584